jgi:NADPH:quinone reductase-like Zn-dependent oxidoreductase
MKAVVIHEYGGPEVLKYEDVPDSVPGPGEVLVRVAASSVNPADLKIRSGAMKHFMTFTFPGIPGLDVSGTVEAIGSHVETSVAPGERVFAHAARTYASRCVVKAATLAKVPEGMDLVEIAALPTVTTTGAQLAALALEGNSGGVVLVTGAAGNVGRSAVFAAKERGATVIAGVLKRQVEEARKTGADRVIALDDADALKSLEPLDAVADTLAGSIAELLIGKVKKGGIFATVLTPPGNAASYPAVKVRPMTVKPDTKTLVHMARAVQAGKLEIPLGPRFALGDASEAHAAAEKGVAGKILLLA